MKKMYYICIINVDIIFFMNRYIRIEEEVLKKTDVVTYYIDKCNNCPLLSYNRNGFTCKCKVFRDENFNNVIKGFVIDVDTRIKEIIDIPEWCKLPTSIEEIKKSNKLYKVLKNGILVTYRDNLSCFPLINNTYSGRDISIEGEIEEDDELFNLFIKHTIDPFSESDSVISVENETKPNGLVCSLCGEIKESVIRKEHSGMCEECYNTSYEDINSIKKAFINNFRLKRNINLINREYKIV